MMLSSRSILLVALSLIASDPEAPFVVQGFQPTASRRPSRCDHDNKLATVESEEPPTATGRTARLGAPVCDYQQVDIPTSQAGPPQQAISVEDLTPIITQRLQESGMQNGVVNVISRHTTTAITINERESRLARDMAEHFLKLVPADERSEATVATSGIRYQHNDIEERPESEEEAQRCLENGWDIENPKRLQAWREQEPINAHSHLIGMLLGSSESIPVVNGKMVIGQWQSILLVDLDGPRDRTVGIQFLGYL